MLARIVSVVAGMALPFLLLAACAVVLSAGSDRDRTGRGRDRLIAAGAGVLAGIVFAILRASAVLTSRTTINLWTLAACVLADLALVVVLILVVRATPRGERDLTQPRIASPDLGVSPGLLGVANAVACAAIFLAFFRACPDVVLQLASFIEPGERLVSTAMLMRLLGFLLAWAAIALIAYAYRRTAALAPRRLFGWAAVGLAALSAFVHLASLVQLLHSSHRIALSGVPFRALVWSVNSSSALVIAAAALLLVPILVAGARTFRRRERQENPARERLTQANTDYTRRWVLTTAAGFALVGLTLTLGADRLNQKITLSEPEPYTLRGGRAIIPISTVEDGHLHRYAYTASDGAQMRFIIVRKSGGAYGVALDACESCGTAGYYEKGGKIICKACDVAMNIATIGFSGGCNPIPLEFVLADGAIEIETASLDALSPVFA